MPLDMAHLELFVLVFIRVTSALMVLPIFQHVAVPALVKSALGALVALLLIPVIPLPPLPASGTLLDFLLPALRETVCGILLGFAGLLLFYVVDVAGQLVGFQAGFSVVASMDPNSGVQSTVITQLFNLTAILIFLALDGHHILLRALADSFVTVRVGSLALDGRFPEWAFTAAKGILVLGIRMAAPLMVTLLLTDIGLGILTRVAPALHIFVVGFPLKVAATLLVVAITLGAAFSVFSGNVSLFARNLPAFLKLMAVP